MIWKKELQYEVACGADAEITAVMPARLHQAAFLFMPIESFRSIFSIAAKLPEWENDPASQNIKRKR